MLIDSHSHIDGAEFQLDIDEVFARMKEAEVGGRRRSSEYQG